MSLKTLIYARRCYICWHDELLIEDCYHSGVNNIISYSSQAMS